MKDQEKRKHQRDKQRDEDAADATAAAVRENERLEDALLSMVEASTTESATIPPPKRAKGSSGSSPSRTSNTAASVLETTATPPHYEPPTSLLLELNQKLLNSIVECDYETYNQLCADDMTCMEPESHHQVVVGKEFHKYYFDLFGSALTEGKGAASESNVTMSQPHIQWLGGTPRRHPMVAVISYVKLTQTLRDEKPVTIPQSETRVWELSNGQWKNVHFHKSTPLK